VQNRNVYQICEVYQLFYHFSIGLGKIRTRNYKITNKETVSLFCFCFRYIFSVDHCVLGKPFSKRYVLIE